MSAPQGLVALVQARMGSKRFPGKMLVPLGGMPILERVLRRTLGAKGPRAVILALPDAPDSAPLRALALHLGVEVFAGAEDDVLGRMLGAAEASGAAHALRVCADNPFIAPAELDRLAEFYFREKPDYAFNHVPRLGNGYPDGLGAEILSTELLRRVAREAKEPRQREHVTLWLWDRAEAFRFGVLKAPAAIAYPKVKLDVDAPADLERLERLGCARDPGASAETVVRDYLALYPEAGR